MRVPFPHALSIGTDICRARRILDWAQPARFEHNAHGLALLKRVLHRHDFAELQRRYPWWQRPSAAGASEAQVRSLSLFLAGRWAAKEAARKAWRADLVGWKDLWVDAGGRGGAAPEIVCCVAGTTDNKPWVFDADELARLAEGDDAHGPANTPLLEQAARLSISHDGEYAVATVLAAPLHADIVAALQQRRAGAASRAG